MGAPLPYAVRGEGYRLWDDRGRELIDTNNNFTTLIHGHAHPVVVEAAERALRDGACFGIPNTYEWDHAEALLTRFPKLDQVRYANSGTEAVMTAIRVARAHTGRDGVIVVRDAYHGTSDVALSTGDAKLRRGVPAGVLGDITQIAVNDAAGLEAAVGADSHRYAAIIIDPMPNRAGLVAMRREFLELARSLADRHGIVLICDEVITFRLAVAGLTFEQGVAPDLITLGKLIGGGFPVGAVVGREEVMRQLDPHSPEGLEHGGTFAANPVTMAAGLASLLLFDAREIQRLNDLGDEARGIVGARLEEVGWGVRGRGSIFRPFPLGQTRVDKQIQRDIWWAAYERNLLISQHTVVALSTPMDREVVLEIAHRLTDAVLEVIERSEA
jgi:glutamate-1-semialdehyde 2,1-aminomutase